MSAAGPANAADTGDKSTQQTENPQIQEALQLLKFLREENRANRDSLQRDSDASRELLLKSLKMIAYPVTALIVVLGFLGYKSMSDIKASIQAEADRETKAEIARMQQNIHSRLDEQFRTPVLQGMVRSAAKDATTTAAAPLIRSEVGTQVKSRVDSEVRRSVEVERGEIHKSVLDQTKAAVRSMDSQIGSLVKDAVDNKVSTEIQPVIAQLKTTEQVQLLISKMNADDATAFDQANAMINDKTLATDLREALFASVRTVYLEHNKGFYSTRTFSVPVSGDQLKQFMSDPNPLTGQAALDALLQKPKDTSLLPKIVAIIGNDHSLAVRASAYRLFNTWTGQKFDVLDTAILPWWAQNGKRVMEGK